MSVTDQSIIVKGKKADFRQHLIYKKIPILPRIACCFKWLNQVPSQYYLAVGSMDCHSTSISDKILNIALKIISYPVNHIVSYLRICISYLMRFHAYPILPTIPNLKVF